MVSVLLCRKPQRIPDRRIHTEIEFMTDDEVIVTIRTLVVVSLQGTGDKKGLSCSEELLKTNYVTLSHYPSVGNYSQAVERNTQAHIKRKVKVHKHKQNLWVRVG